MNNTISTDLSEMAKDKVAKLSLSKSSYILKAMYSGILLSVLYIVCLAIKDTFSQVTFLDTSLLPVGTYIADWVFGIALIFIYLTKSELLTSNMMIATSGVYKKTINIGQMINLFIWCYIGNLLGGILIGFLLSISTILNPHMLELLQHTVDGKLAYLDNGFVGYVDLFVRAILCNFFICLCLFVCYVKQVTNDVAKIISIAFGVFIFMLLGLEHSIANTNVFTMAIMLGLNASFVKVVIALVVAIIGNYVGGGLMVGLAQTYINDTKKK
ncbi:MAG: formate/nitrite transporter family protein [Mycoplasmatales bacterium]